MSDPKTFPRSIPTGLPAADWTDRPLARGRLRISGTVLHGDAAWHAYRDALGWTNVVLLAHERLVGEPRAPGLVALCDEAMQSSIDPVSTARLIARRLGSSAHDVSLAIVRIGPHHSLLEALNVSMPALVLWDPYNGMNPYEPLATSLGTLPSDAATEVIRLRPGAALFAATSGLLAPSAGFGELRRFLTAAAIDPLGGDVASASPSELSRSLRASWPIGAGPSAMCVVGLPSDPELDLHPRASA
ncbi:MAG: hypothetical protein AB7S26_24055 [Sandaracinaceae bacterium]